MNLRALDIRLLMLFDTLMAERNVTRAADRLGLTQSAASNALARLRGLFEDDLFVRGPDGMTPTPRALDLGPAIRDALDRLEIIAESGESFDPKTTTHDFAIRIADLTATLLLPELLAYFHIEAPKAKLRAVDMPAAEIRQALHNNAIDLAIGRDSTPRKELRAETLFIDRLVCVVRRDHPAAARKLTLDAFLKLRHIKFALNRGDDRSLDETMAQQGLKRDIALYVPYWLVLPPVLCATDLTVVMSARLFQGYDDDRLVALPLPLDVSPDDFEIIWHRRHDHHAPHRWLRHAVRHATKHLDQR